MLFALDLLGKNINFFWDMHVIMDLLIISEITLDEPKISSVFDYITYNMISAFLTDPRFSVTLKKQKHKFHENYLKNKTQTYDHVLVFCEKGLQNNKYIKYLKAITIQSYNSFCLTTKNNNNEHTLFHIIPSIPNTNTTYIGPFINNNSYVSNKQDILTFLLFQHSAPVINQIVNTHSDFDLNIITTNKKYNYASGTTENIYDHYELLRIMATTNICILTDYSVNYYTCMEMLVLGVTIVAHESLKSNYIGIDDIIWFTNDLDWTVITNHTNKFTNNTTCQQICDIVFDRLTQQTKHIVPVVAEAEQQTRTEIRKYAPLLQSFY